MNNFIPYEKLSKKEKRELDNSRRGTWGELNPVTRRPVPSKAYNRSKARKCDNRCFADACFANQNGIVFGTAI